jgi:excisionase family DNA binding protein
MKENNWLAPREAAELVGCSRTHIQNLIKKGELSSYLYGKRYRIEKSELFSVFPEAHRKAEHNKVANKSPQALKVEIENEYLKEIISILEKENAFLKSQIEANTKERAQMLDSLQS